MITLPSPVVSRKKGFGLVETLIAVSVLALVLGVSVMLGSVMLRNSALTAQSVQASNLAREQLEKVRNIRDTIWINPTFSSCGSGQWDCWVDEGGISKRNTSVNDIISDSSSEDFVLREDDEGYYLAASTDPIVPETLAFAGTDVKFEGKVTIKAIDSNQISPFTLEGQSDTANLSESDSSHGKKIYQIDSTVSWDDYGRDNSVTLTTYLSDWLPRF